MKNAPIFLFFALVFCVFGAQNAQAQMQIPSCEGLEQWVSTVPLKSKSREEDAVLERLFSDASVTPIFGVPFMNWSAVETDLVNSLLQDCGKQAKKRGGDDAAKRLEFVSRTLGKAQRMKKSGFKTPECIFIYQWIARGTQLPGNISADIPQETKDRLLFADSYIVPLFGTSYDKWRKENRTKAIELLGACRMRMSKDSDKSVADGLDAAMKFIASGQ